MELECIKNIKNLLELQFIRTTQIFISFPNFYKQFIENFIAIVVFFISMLKIDLGFLLLKLIKKRIITLFKLSNTLFLMAKAKELFQRLDKDFCKEIVL